MRTILLEGVRFTATKEDYSLLDWEQDRKRYCPDLSMSYSRAVKLIADQFKTAKIPAGEISAITPDTDPGYEANVVGINKMMTNVTMVGMVDGIPDAKLYSGLDYGKFASQDPDIYVLYVVNGIIVSAFTHIKL